MDLRKSFSLAGSAQSSSRSLLSSSSQMMQSAASGMSQGGKTMSLGLGSLTKTVSGAMSSLPPLPSLSTDNENKKKMEEKAQTAFVLALLEDVRLQSPPSHSGFVVAFTTATVSPLTNAGVKFRWFKMNSAVSDQFHQVDESSRAWYPPTADDIGSKICVQCEDTLGQGFSRYIESSVIEADPALSSIVESSLEREYYEVKDTGISIGTQIRDFNDEVAVSSSTSSSIGSPNSALEDAALGIDIRSRPSALSTSASFMAFEGRSFVEVDADGIFISLPPPRLPGSNNANAGGQSAAAIGGGSAGGSSGGRNGTTTDQVGGKRVRRGLHIAPSEGIHVQCTQPVSLVISIPLVRDGVATEASSSDGVVAEASNSSGRIVMPWTYVREIQSIHASSASGLTTDQIAEEELEASSFGSILMSLEQLMSSLPNSCGYIRICVSCGDRTQRDALACMVRGLAAQRLGATISDRLAVMPWKMFSATSLSTNNKDRMDSIDKANSIQELGRRLKELEQENAQLRKERFELPIPTAPVRRASRNDKSSAASVSIISADSADGFGVGPFLPSEVDVPVVTADAATNAEDSQAGSKPNDHHAPDEVQRNHDLRAASLDQFHNEFGHVSVDSSDSEHVSPGTSKETTSPARPQADFASAEATRMLSAKVLELEKKLSISARREAEAVKLRQEVDARSSRVNAENEKVKAAIVLMEAQTSEATAELTSQRQICKDLKHTLELECAEHARAKVLVRELDELRPVLASNESAIKELTQLLQAANEELDILRPTVASLEANLKEELTRFAAAEDVAAKRISQLESELATVKLERDTLANVADRLAAEIETQRAALAQAAVISAQNDERAATIDALTGEIKHLHRRAESQGRDLKKVLKENAVTLSEFEKALIRKSGECDEIGFKVITLQEEIVHLQRELAEAQQGPGLGRSLLRGFGGGASNASTSYNDGLSNTAATTSSQYTPTSSSVNNNLQTIAAVEPDASRRKSVATSVPDIAPPRGDDPQQSPMQSSDSDIGSQVFSPTPSATERRVSFIGNSATSPLSAANNSTVNSSASTSNPSALDGMKKGVAGFMTQISKMKSLAKTATLNTANLAPDWMVGDDDEPPSPEATAQALAASYANAVVADAADHHTRPVRADSGDVVETEI